MRFELPGLTAGPTDDELGRLHRHRIVVQAPADPQDEARRAAALGLSVEAVRALDASLAALRRP